MIDLLKLSQKHGILSCSRLSNRLCPTVATIGGVQHLLNAEDLRHSACEAIDVGALERYARPLPVMLEYDRLLTAGGAR